MNSVLYKKVEKFVVDSFTKTGEISQIKHFKRTVYWVKQLKNDADEALLISAVAHDIERAFMEKFTLKKETHLTDENFLRPHEERGAQIISDFLKSQGADTNLIERVKMLVSRHEEGGNEEQNLIKDADSISFFENNINLFLDEQKMKIEKEKVKEKLDWMFNRISSEKAKEIARPWYEEAIKKIGFLDDQKLD